MSTITRPRLVEFGTLYEEPVSNQLDEIYSMLYGFFSSTNFIVFIVLIFIVLFLYNRYISRKQKTDLSVLPPSIRKNKYHKNEESEHGDEISKNSFQCQK
jgi:hypothetical protein